jgi:hypothetical protein
MDVNLACFLTVKTHEELSNSKKKLLFLLAPDISQIHMKMINVCNLFKKHIRENTYENN